MIDFFDNKVFQGSYILLCLMVIERFVTLACINYMIYPKGQSISSKLISIVFGLFNIEEVYFLFVNGSSILKIMDEYYKVTLGINLISIPIYIVIFFDAFAYSLPDKLITYCILIAPAFLTSQLLLYLFIKDILSDISP